ncbi:MAG: metallophosphoesterase [Oscillospiraceae bacterium]|nr:metallophosphoesterase [Oscillospiraceae bacterium]
MSSDDRNAGRKHRVLPWVLLLLIVAVAALLLDSYYRIVTTEYVLEYSNLPDAFDGFRIAVLSDIHAAVFGKDNIRLVSKVRDTAPDIIVIAGDFTDHYDKPPIDGQLAIAENLVSELSLIAPLYYITGNHEWDDGGIRELLPMLEEHGVTVLRNKYVLLESGGESLVLAGTDDPNGPADMTKPEEFVERVRQAEGDSFFIMLEHRNGNLPLYSELGIDLVLSGHAHGGIIRLPFTDGLIGPSREWLPSYTNGLYSMGSTNMVVSRGIGNHTGWPRFLNNPHIPVVILKKG